MSLADAGSAATRSPGAHRLFILGCIDLGWFVARTLLLKPQVGLPVDLLLTLFNGTVIVSLLFAVMRVALLVGLAGEVGARPAAGPLRVAIGLAVACLLVSALGVVARFGGPNLLRVPGEFGHVITAGFFAALYLAFDVAFWLTLTRLLGGGMTRSLHAAFFALRLTYVALTLLELVFEEAFRKGDLLVLDQWLSPSLRVAWCAVVLVALHRLSQRASASEASGAPEPASGPDGKTDLLVGGLLLGGGLLVTLASYSSASGGGRYVVTTGAIAVGIVRIVRGLTRVSRGAR